MSNDIENATDTIKPALSVISKKINHKNNKGGEKPPCFDSDRILFFRRCSAFYSNGSTFESNGIICT